MIKHKKKKPEEKVPHYFSPRWSYQILESSMPMTFDQYSHCSFNCKYCLAYYQKSLKCVNPLMPGETKNYRHLRPRSVNVNSFSRLMKGKNPKAQFNDYVALKYPLEWGGLADPFCRFEDKYATGLQCMYVLDELNYPTSFSTKGINFVKDDRYMEMFARQDRWRMQFSISNLDAGRARIMEQGCPSPEARLDAMGEFNRIAARPATLRIRPFIIGFSDREDEYLDLIDEAYERGCRRVSMEFFCLQARLSPGVAERYSDMNEILGFDVLDFYKKNSPGQPGYLRLNWRLKTPFVERMLARCKKRKMAFYASDQMVKDMSRSFGNAPDFVYRFRGNFSEAMRIAMQRGLQGEEPLVYWKDIEWRVREIGLHKFLWRHAEGYNTVGNNCRARRWSQRFDEWMHEIWNLPNTYNSPYRHFYGVLLPVKVDERGDVVYKYVPREGVNYIGGRVGVIDNERAG